MPTEPEFRAAETQWQVSLQHITGKPVTDLQVAQFVLNRLFGETELTAEPDVLGTAQGVYLATIPEWANRIVGAGTELVLTNSEYGRLLIELP